MNELDLSTFTVGELGKAYRQVLDELRKREVVRTGNAPIGDYAEWLVAKAVKGTLAPNSTKSWDVETPDGLHLQVKSRCVTDPTKAGERQLSPFRSWDFDAAVVVLLDGDFAVWRAARVPVDALKAVAKYSRHVNGNRVMARDELLKAGDDWTTRIAKAARAS